MSDKITKQKRHFFAAWLVGGAIYMIFGMEVVADSGAIALPFQLIMGVVFSTIILGIASLIGLLLRVPLLGRIWYSSSVPSIVVLVIAILVICFGRSIGLTITLTSPESNTTFETLNPVAAYSSMLGAVFAVLHFSWSQVSHDIPSA